MPISLSEFDSSRRNPLTPAMERQKQAERKSAVKANLTCKPIDQVYALALGPKDDPVIVYVGVSIHPLIRFKQHVGAIELGIDTKPAYEFIRYDKRRDTLHLIILDAIGEMTEEEWRKELLALGHPLQNATGGNDVKRKQREKKLSLDEAVQPRTRTAQEVTARIQHMIEIARRK